MIPWARIAAKSVATVDGAGYSQPSSSGRNLPVRDTPKGQLPLPGPEEISRALAPSPLSLPSFGSSSHAAAAQKDPLARLRGSDKDAKRSCANGWRRVNERAIGAMRSPSPSRPRPADNSLAQIEPVCIAAGRIDFHSTSRRYPTSTMPASSIKAPTMRRTAAPVLPHSMVAAESVSPRGAVRDCRRNISLPGTRPLSAASALVP